jgi:hippurate hydrolase
MPIVNRVAAMQEELTQLRRDLHAHPEILYEVHRTAGVVAERLTAYGCDEVVPGIGRSGVVGVIRGRKNGSGRVVGLRADMDALPIEEATGLPYASKVPGRMHACGHDGHTTMLLGAARYLCETRNFDGTVVLIFQPAEEGGAGAKAMLEDGLVDRWGIQEVYGFHNQPGLAVGHFAIRAGPLMAASDRIYITIEGKGGHAAKPHQCIDTVLVGAHIITALQSVVARNIDPLEAGVVSICMFHAGNAQNVIPSQAKLTGTARSLMPHVRDLLEERVVQVAESTAAMFGARAEAIYKRDYPVTRNHERQAAFAAAVAAEVCGRDRVDTAIPPVMGGEDFSFLLESRPGAFIFMGNGDSAGLHHPAYDFNDDAITTGVSYWIRLAEMAMPA